MTEQEYIEDVIDKRDDNSYPAVVRTADPLLIRFSKTSLLVNSNNFWIKVKRGLAFTGFVIYTSGLGTPISEIALDTASTITTDDGKTVYQKASDWSDGDLERKAKEILDTLEARIAITESSNEIKKAIDRLCWQIHYDITDSEEGKNAMIEDGMSDVSIATQGTTIKTDFNNVVSEMVSGTASTTFQLSGVEDQLSYINNAIGTTLTNKMGEINTTISGTLNTTIQKISLSLTGNTEHTVYESIDKVATNLRGNGEYTISKALRETNDSSVSGATYQQTQLEQEHFTEISVNQLGTLGVTHGNRSLFESLGEYANIDDPNTHESYPTLYSDITDISEHKIGNPKFGDTSTIFDKIGNQDDNSGKNTIFGRIGNDGDVSGTATIFGYIKQVNDRSDDAKTAAEDAKTASEGVSNLIGTTGDDIDGGKTTLFAKVNRIKDSLGDFTQESVGQSLYGVLLGNGDANKGAFSLARGYTYASDHTDPFYIGQGDSNYREYTKYFVNTEISRFAIAYNSTTNNRPNIGTSSQNPYYNSLRSVELPGSQPT